MLNRFSTRIPVAAGQRIGLSIIDAGADFSSGCGRGTIGTAADFIHYRSPIAPVGAASPAMAPANTQYRLDLAALIEPDTDGDGFGDETQDACAGTAGPNGGCPPPDTAGPVVTITAGPKSKTKKTKATFTFAANEAATFECALDKQPFFPCGSPVTFGHVKRKRHTFQVRGTDTAKNIGAAVAFHWKVKKRRGH